ncbi:MAG: type III-B CRISPR-associated protein Cas10/Cmr2 [Anaerolineaceae bacterium]
MKTVFLCSLGPVQEFIVNARRSRDLWYGSWMLSELAKSVAKTIDDIGGNLIFPKPDDLDAKSTFNCPNRVSAVFDKFDYNLAGTIKKSAQDRLLELWDESLGHILKQAEKQNVGLNDLFTFPSLPEEQIKDLLEFYWVAVSYEEGDYPKARDLAEALLAARKNTRDFDLRDGEEIPKSSLDGIRESVIPEKYYKNSSKQTQFLYEVYRARGAERLSGVDLLKRLGRLGDEPIFASTSDVAAAPLMSTLEESDQEKLINDLKKMLTGEGILPEEISENASLIFESRFKEYLGENANQKEILEKHHDRLKKVFKGAVPYPYYSLFIADGDNMGKLINSLEDIYSHSLLSQKLSQFAANLPQVINGQQYKGTCIYAGGEDILAYLPLHTALEFVSFINGDFSEKIKTTLSGGLVIAHHLTPLNEVMRLAREAEKKSKKTASKNALTVVLSKRSGTETEITDCWGRLTNRLLILKGWIKADLLGQGVGYELKNLAEDFKGFDLRTNKTHRDAIAKEAVRIINRKRHSNTGMPLNALLKQKLEDWIVTDEIPVAQIADEIIVASEFTN